MFGTGGIRRILGTAVTLAAVGALLVLSPLPARASADGCDEIGNHPRSCVQVRGAGTFVDWVRGGVTLGPRQDTRGHFEVWGHGFRHFSADETLANDSFVAHTKWGRRFDVGRDLPAGSKVCARFYERRADGGYSQKQPACVEIQT